MNYERHGTTLLAVLVVAIMGLSVFAMPAAADTTDDTADFVVNADEISNIDDANPVSETLNISIDENTADDVAEGDTIRIELNKAGIDDIDDFRIAGASASGSGDIDQVDAITGQQGPYVGVEDDAVTLNLTSLSNSGGTQTGTIEVTLDLNVKSQVEGKAASYSGTEVIAQVTDGGSASLSGLNYDAATMEIKPGAPDQITLDSQSYENNYDGTTQVTATVEDAYGNANTSVSPTPNIEFNLTSSATDLDRGFVQAVDAGDGTGAQAQVDIATDGDIQPAVGDSLQISASNSSVVSDTSTADVTIYPDKIKPNFGSDFTTDEKSTTFDFQLDDSGDSPIPNSDIDSIDVDFSLDSPTNAVTLEDTTSSFLQDLSETRTQTITSQKNATNYTFSTTSGGSYTLNVDEPTGNVDGSDTVSVNSGSPSKVDLELDKNEATYDEAVTVTASILDDDGNTVDVGEYYGSTDVTITLGSTSNIDERTGTITIDGDDSGSNTLTIQNNTGDIQPALGDFEVSASQDFDSSLTEPNNESLTINPDAVSLTEETSTQVDAGSNNPHALSLNGTGDNNAIPAADVDEVTVDFSLTDNTDVPGASPSISDVNLTSSATFTNEKVEQNELLFNATNAGNYEVEASVNDAVSDTSSEFDVVPLAPSNANVNVVRDFVGVVSDDETSVDVELTLTDKYNNYANYDGAGNNFANIDVSTADLTPTLTDPSVADVTYLTAENATETVNFDPNGIAPGYGTGTETVTATETGSSTDIGTTSVELVHEAQNVQNQFHLTSLPQAAQVHFNGSVTDVKQYNQSKAEVVGESAYSTLGSASSGDTLNLDEIDADALHKGIYVETDGTARVGHDFATADDQKVDVGEVELNNTGYYLLGSNFDISAAGGNREIEEELNLRQVDKGENINDFSGIVAKNASGVTMADQQSVSAYEGYWVKIEEDSVLPAYRGVEAPTYDPVSRDNQ